MLQLSRRPAVSPVEDRFGTSETERPLAVSGRRRIGASKTGPVTTRGMLRIDEDMNAVKLGKATARDARGYHETIVS